MALRQLRQLREEIKATPSIRRVLLGKAFDDCPDLLELGRDDYSAMIIVRELMNMNRIRHLRSMLGQQGRMPGSVTVLVDLETDALSFTTKEFHPLRALIEQGRDDDAGEVIMRVAGEMR